jgi:hypothetical protein
MEIVGSDVVSMVVNVPLVIEVVDNIEDSVDNVLKNPVEGGFVVVCSLVEYEDSTVVVSGMLVAFEHEIPKNSTVTSIRSIATNRFFIILSPSGK